MLSNYLSRNPEPFPNPGVVRVQRHGLLKAREGLALAVQGPERNRLIAQQARRGLPDFRRGAERLQGPLVIPRNASRNPKLFPRGELFASRETACSEHARASSCRSKAVSAIA